MATAARRGTPVPEITTRVLSDGTQLKYCLTVIQEPERARACGSGAKSSADRRPVDPPPVVELRILQNKNGVEEDITFVYSANFFLFATLEAARPMAHGRVQQPAASQQPPVLSGMPVSGMAYLDRPKEAGYFIFPDLSVRHEGMYRLSFNLYEEMRDRDENMDSQADKSRGMNSTPGAPDSSFDWRMEVKSMEFVVFSAKKFPGLTESTTLSRTVAEQGCRVRIRRDIRMRRRGGDGKNGKDFDDEAEPYRGRTQEQDYEEERARSLSGSPPGADRRQYDASGRPYAENTSYNGSPVGGPAPRPGNYLSYLDQQQAPQSHFAQPPPPPSQSYPAPPPPQHQPYQAPYQAPSQPQYRAPAPQGPQSAHNYYERPQPQSAFPSNPPREQREFDEFRRSSIASYPPSQHVPSMDLNYNRAPSHAYPRANSPPFLAPLKNLEPRIERPSSPVPLSAIRTIAPPLPSPTYRRAHEAASGYRPYDAPIAAIDPVREAASSNGKRTYAAFQPNDTHEPLVNGMRPSSSHGADDDDEIYDPLADKELMAYKRADGTRGTRVSAVS